MGLITDLRGRTFGRLIISTRAEPVMRHGNAYWPCQCECGNHIEARGSKLQSGRIVSCGCQKADPNIRRAARLQVSAKRRRAIAQMGGRARART